MRLQTNIAKFACAGLVALATVAPPRIAAAADMQPGRASEFIRGVTEDALHILRSPDLPKAERDAKFRALLKDRFDMTFIGRFTLGRYWQTSTPAQRDAYLQAFTEYVLQVYSKRLDNYAGETIRVISERPAGEQDTIVLSRVERPAQEPMEIQWRVRAVDGTPRIIDVVVAGVSMVVTQRDEFAAVLQQRNVDGLISSMRTRTAELQKQG